MKTLESFFPRLNTKQLALLGLLTALLIILSRFTFGPDTLKFGFSFIAAALIGKWYGPIWGMFVAFISDFLSNLSSAYAYFPGFAFSAIVGALIYGFGFYQHKQLSLMRILIVTGLVIIIVNLFLNTVWVATLQNLWNNPNALKTVFTARLIKQLIFLPIETGLLYLILNNPSLERMRAEVFNN
ncbi:folate family ECF transporter S component [Weissella minor]|uniref:folate family ECF transporter S component n=1 Tax=Weissella minor TaxID=1620 RepID=UPI001BB0678A|nr:folate family ECF transporter S component [Weissella minor]MBS0949837.1 folate family ECF transporter S component [Weissella minor]